jgi:hypothetical protein
MARRTLRLSLLLVPPLVLLGALVWVFWLRSGPEPANVTIYERNLPVAVATRSQALAVISERVGFVPILPDRLPLEGLSLVGVRSIVPPDVPAGEERTHLIFSGADTAEALLQMAQGSVYWGPDLDQARTLDVGVDTIDAYALQPAGSAGPQFWLRTDGTYIYILVIGSEPISDADVLPMLESIAGRMRQ